MSATIDERIVRMEFDNKDFEKNVSTSLSTLDKLRNALTFTKQKEELSTLSKAIDTKGFDALGKSVDVVREKFSALDIAWMETVRKITDGAINAGERMVKSLSIDQIASGWDKYARITSSVQTILAATREQGETMESVTEQIEKLSWFTDETSYSLNDMTDNIAKFTSNGIELKAATTEMQGIAVAAALAGANTQEASHAMSGFSKAMGEGSMKRQHWQWIQTAHVDTMQFKQTLIDTAVELGTLREVGEGVYETLEGNEVTVSNFETAMKDAWITTDVMSNTLELYGAFSDQLYEASQMTGLTASELLDALEKYQNGGLDINKFAQETGKSAEDLSMIMEILNQDALNLGNKAFRAAQEAKTFQEAIDSVKDAVSSGWMKTFELIFGNYEEAKVLWTDFANAMYDVFAESGNARNAILELWRAMEGGDGREVLIEGISNIFNAVTNLVGAAKGGLISSFFGDAKEEEILAMIAEKLSDITNKFRDFTKNMLLSDESLEKVSDIFKKFGDTLQNVYKYYKDFAYSISPLAKIFSALFDSAKRITSAFGMLFDRLRDSRRDSGETVDIFKKIYEVIDTLSDHLSSVIGLMTTFVDMFIVNDLYFFIESVRDLVDEFKKFNEETGLLNEIVETLKSTLSGSFDIFLALTRSVIRIYKAFGRLFDKLKGNRKETENTYENFGTLHDKIEDVADSITDAIDKVTEFFEKLIDTKLSSFIETIKNGVDRIKKFNEETGILTKTMEVLGTVVAAPFYIIYKFVTIVASLIKQFLSLPEVQKVITIVFDSIAKFGENAYKKIVDLVEYMKKLDVKKFISDIGKVFSDTKGKINDFFQNLEDRFTIITTIKEEFEKAIDNFKLLTGGVSAHTLYDEFDTPLQETEKSAFNLKETLGLVIDNIKTFFQTIDANKLIALTFSLTMLGMFIQVSNLVKAFTILSNKAGTAVTSVTGVFDSVKKTFDTVSKTIGSFAKKERMKLTEIAQAILLLSISLAGLALMDSKYHDNLINASVILLGLGAALLVFTGVLTAISKAAKKADSFKELLALDAAMVALSISVLILSAAVKVLEGIDFVEAEKNVLILAELAAIIGGVTVLVTRFSGKGFTGFLAMLAMALILNQFAKALVTLSEADFTNAQENIKALIVIFAGLSLLAMAASHIGVFSVIGMLVLILSLNKIVPALKELLTEMKFADGLDKILTVLENHTQIVMSLGILLAAMIMVSSMFGNGIKKFGIGILAFAAAFVVVSKAIKVIGEIDTEKVDKALNVVIAVLGLFTALALVIGITNGGKNALRISAAIMFMTMSLYPIAGAIWLLGSMSEKKVKQGTAAVAALMACFAVIVAASGLVEKSKVSIGAIIAVVVGVILLTSELIVLTFIPIENIKSSALALGGVMLTLAALFAAIGKAGKASAVGAIFQLIIMAVLLGEAAYSLYLLADYPWENILGAAVSLGIVMLAMSLALSTLDVKKISHWMRSWQIFGELLFLLVPTVVALSALSDVSRRVGWENLLASAVALDIALVGIVNALNDLDVSKISHYKRSTEIFMELLGVLIPTVIAIGGLGYISSQVGWSNVIAASVGLAIVLPFITSALSNLDVSKISHYKRSTEIFVELLGVLIPTVAAIGVLGLISSQVGWSNVIAAAVAIDIVFTDIMFCFDKFQPKGILNAIDSAKLLVELFAILIPVVAALWFLSNYGGEWDNMIGSAISISIMVGSLSLVCAVLSKLGLEVAPAVKAALAVGLFIDILVALIGAMALGIGYIPDDIYARIIIGLERMKQVMGKIGEMIGSFIGGIAGGAIEKVLEDTGKGLEKFSQHAVVFTDWIQTIDDKVSNGSKHLALALLYLSASKVVDGLSRLINPLGNFTIKGSFKTLGEGVQAFAESVSDVDVNKVENAARAAEAILKINAPNQGGLISLFTGENALWFFNPLTLGGMGFGGGLASFARSVTGITLENVQGAIDIAQALFELDPPNSGGIISVFTGENFLGFFNPLTIGEFGFGGGLKSFANAVSGISFEDAMDGLLVAQALFELDPPNSGGFISWFTGDNSLWNFNWLTLGPVGFGGGIKSFANCLKGINYDEIEGGMTVMKEIMALRPPKTGGLLSWFLGNNSLWTFNWFTLGPSGFGGGIAAFAFSIKGIQLDDVIGGLTVAKILCGMKPESKGGLLSMLIGGSLFGLGPLQLGENGLGGGIAEFCKCVAPIENDALMKATIASGVLTVLNNIEIPRTGGFIGWLDTFISGGAKNNFKKMAEYFGYLGDAVYSFSSKATQIDAVKATLAVSNMQMIMGLLKSSAEFDERKITGFSDAMNQAGNLGIKAFTDAFYNAQEKIDAAIGSFAKKVNKSISDHQDELNSGMSGAANGLTSTFTTDLGIDSSGYSELFKEYTSQGVLDSANLGLTDDSKLNELLGNSQDISKTIDEGVASKLGIDTSGYSDLFKGYTSQGVLGSAINGITDPTMVDGLKEMTAESFGVVPGALDTVLDMTKSGESKVATTAGNNFVSSFAGSLYSNEKVEEVTRNISLLGQPAIDKLNEFVDKAAECGRNVAAGFVAGIGDSRQQSAAASNAWSLSNRVEQQWINDFQMHSPSKVTEQYGKYIVEGFALGMSNNYGEAVDAAQGLSETMLDAFSGMGSDVSDYVAENLDLNPSVTPFLDVSGLQRDANNINSLFEDSQGLTINSHLGAMTDMFGEMNTNSLMSNNQIVSSLQSLHEDVQNLQNVVGNLQVIMDSGTLVGAIAPNMDVALGQMAMYKRRGM